MPATTLPERCPYSVLAHLIHSAVQPVSARHWHAGGSQRHPRAGGCPHHQLKGREVTTRTLSRSGHPSMMHHVFPGMYRVDPAEGLQPGDSHDIFKPITCPPPALPKSCTGLHSSSAPTDIMRVTLYEGQSIIATCCIRTHE
jgi:hypothetical protein